MTTVAPAGTLTDRATIQRGSVMGSSEKDNRNLFDQVAPAWASAHQQAAKIPYLKDRRTKRQQIALLCETLKRALKGGK